jgi:hypothetical protein
MLQKCACLLKDVTSIMTCYILLKIEEKSNKSIASNLNQQICQFELLFSFQAHLVVYFSYWPQAEYDLSFLKRGLCSG